MHSRMLLAVIGVLISLTASGCRVSSSGGELSEGLAALGGNSDAGGSGAEVSALSSGPSFASSGGSGGGSPGASAGVVYNPEPGTMALFGGGMAAVGLLRRRKARRQRA